MVVVWKVFAVVANCWIKRSVTLHDALHGFRAGRGTGTVPLESKLVQQLAGISHEPLFQVLVDLCKAYDLLDRGRCMDILQENEMGHHMARLIPHHWDK